MLFNYNHLKNYIDIKLSPSDLGLRLTMAGIETKVIDEKKKILEAEVTPNRYDCLSYIGLAREIKAIEGGKLKFPNIKIKELNTSIKNLVKISITNKKACLRYMARVIDNVRIGESPQWLKDFLEGQGLRSVNNIVDITNFVLMEYGQPLHAFDFEKLQGKKVIVRSAKSGEKIVTIDGQERVLDESVLVIADAEKPQAVAGIMGGLDSEVTANTTFILLESAFFNPSSVYKTSRKLNLKTDSSYRFERRVDCNAVESALDRAASLIQEIAGGEIARGRIDLRETRFLPKKIKLRLSRLNDILGTNIKPTEAGRILERLGLKVKEKKGILEVLIPSYRGDLEREIDLIEEVARIYGYEKIPETIPARPYYYSSISESEYLTERKVKQILTSCGMSEVISYPFCYNKDLENLKENTACEMLRLTNPLSIGQDILRQTILPSFINLLISNCNFKNLNLKIFELSNVFIPMKNSSLPNERKILAGLITGFNQGKNWAEQNHISDFYDLKGILENLFQGLNLRNYCFKAGSDASFHPKKTAEIYVEDEKIGILGELHPDINDTYKLSYPVFAFEIEWQKLIFKIPKSKKYMPLPKFPGISRDIAFVVSKEIESEKIISLIKETGSSLIESINIFDLYTGAQISDGHQSLAISIFYRHPDRTLIDDEVESVQNRIKTALIEKFSAQIR